MGALQLMKTGAGRLFIVQTGSFLVENAGATLGLGWLGALLVLSGSPIAATSLALVAAGEDVGRATAAISETQGFTMLTGSRLGAAFVVLVTAVIYALQAGAGGRKAPVSTAVIALSTTALVYVPAAFLGFALLQWDAFHALDARPPAVWVDVIDLVYGPALAWSEHLPGAVVFFLGLGALLTAFKVIDSALPRLGAAAVSRGRSEWLQRKWPMFGIGSLVALVTMSVSIALTVLVPLVAKEYVRRDHIVPYIMGANITTLGDTMLAAFALDSPAAVRIVLAEVIATSVLTLLLLTFLYPRMWPAVWRFQAIFTKSPLRLAAFTAGLFVVPVGTIAVSVAAA